MAELHGLKMGVILTTSKSWDDLPSSDPIIWMLTSNPFFQVTLEPPIPSWIPVPWKKYPSFFPLTEQWIDPTAREIKVGWIVMGGG